MADLERIYLIKFERVGRRRDVPEVVYNAKDADDLAKQIHKYVRKFLASSWYEVTVNLETMTGSIDFGRFGNFTIEDRGDFAQAPSDREGVEA